MTDTVSMFDYLDMKAKADRLTAENEKQAKALQYFIGCAYPVSTEINSRGYNWRSEESLDFALDEAKKAIGSEQ